MFESLRIRGLTVSYQGVTALRDVDVDMGAGQSMAVIGPNGSGKSTLLKAIAGLERADTGTIDIAPTVSPTLVLQSTDVDRSVPISVRETVAMARYGRLGLFGRFKDADTSAVEDAMARLAVDDLAHRQLHDLSGGQRQRVLVAQGLAQEASLILLDEPITGLDVVSRAVILDVIDEERSRGRAVILTTHNLADARRCDLVLLLAGAPVAFGTPEEVLCEEHLRTAFGGRFLRFGDDIVLDDPHHAH